MVSAVQTVKCPLIGLVENKELETWEKAVSLSWDAVTAFAWRKKLRGFSPQSKLYRPSDRRLSAKLVPTSAWSV
jgi:hypothetical protein